jgi:hypothetical protein
MTLLALIVSRGVEVRWVGRLGTSRGYIAVGRAQEKGKRTRIRKSERGQPIEYGDLVIELTKR